MPVTIAHTLDLPLGEVLAPAGPSTPEAVRYCPSCLGEFRPGFAHCRECGVDTVPF